MSFQTSLAPTTSVAHTLGHDGYWNDMIHLEHRAHFLHALQQQTRDEHEGLTGFMHDRQELNPGRRRIPQSEQDEDRWRHVPGRDPVTEERGMGA
jgi:hypothetical protein